MTNFEKIKSMSIDEMACSDMGIFSSCPYDIVETGFDICRNFNGDCIACTKHWLESEAENNEK